MYSYFHSNLETRKNPRNCQPWTSARMSPAMLLGQPFCFPRFANIVLITPLWRSRETNIQCGVRCIILPPSSKYHRNVKLRLPGGFREGLRTDCTRRDYTRHNYLDRDIFSSILNGDLGHFRTAICLAYVVSVRRILERSHRPTHLS